MALTHIHRQIRHQLGKVRVFAKRPRAGCATDMAHDLFNRVFEGRAYLLGQLPGIGERGAVDLPRTGAQHTGGTVQGAVDRAEVRQGMRFGTPVALLAQHFSQALRAAIPTACQPSSVTVMPGWSMSTATNCWRSSSSQAVSNPWLTTAAPEHQALRPSSTRRWPLRRARTLAVGGSAAHMPQMLPSGGNGLRSSAMTAKASVWPSNNLHSRRSCPATWARRLNRSRVWPLPGCGSWSRPSARSAFRAAPRACVSA